MAITTAYSKYSGRRFGMAALLATLALGGCADGVELNGKVFDMLGVSPAAQAAAKTEPKMAARTGLVLPPDQQRLPVPGSVDPAEPDAALAAVNDPDQRKKLAAAERARLHKAYCSGDLNWKQRLADPNSIPQSPYGSCSVVSDTVKGAVKQ